MAVPRIAWTDLPTAVHGAIEECVGPVRDARTVSAGFNSPMAAVLDTVAGRVFVKGVPVGRRGVATQAREAAMAPHLGDVAPALRWHLPDAAGWDVLVFECVEGRHADYAPGSPDLPLVVEVLVRVGALPCPPDAPVREARRAFRAYVTDPADADLFDGDALLHTDCNPENVLVPPDGRARLVDWAWAARGAAWIDPCVLAVRLIAAGNTPEEAERIIAEVPAWVGAPEAGVTAFAAASARLWREIAEQDPLPWKRGMAAAARAWVDAL